MWDQPRWSYWSVAGVSDAFNVCGHWSTVDPRPVLLCFSAALCLFLMERLLITEALHHYRCRYAALVMTMIVHSAMLIRARLLPNDPFARRKRLLLRQDGPRYTPRRFGIIVLKRWRRLNDMYNVMKFEGSEDIAV